MSLFKKPKGKINVRASRTDSDDEETNNDFIKPDSTSEVDSLNKSQGLTSEVKSTGDDGSSGIPVVPVEAASSSVTSTNKDSSQPIVGEKKFDPSVKLKLSFGDEEEEETDVFQVKKSATSRRIAKQLKREKKRKEKEEKLEEAKRSESKSSISEQIFSIKEDSTSEISDPSTSFKEPDIHVKEISYQFKPMKEGHIPSAKEIYAARKKREEDRKKMRMDNMIEDFISVEEETEAERIALGHRDDEQPVYEEDADNDNDDEDDRIDFAVDTEAKERERAREAFIQAQEDSETLLRTRNNADSDDSEDEVDLWENEQIRKGVGFSIGSTNRNQHPNNHLNDLMTKLDLPSTRDKSSISSSSIPNYLPKIPSSKATADHIKQLSDDISESISLLARQINEDEQELKSIKSEREQLLVEVKELEDKLKESGLDDDSPTELLRNWKKGQTFNPTNEYDDY